MKNKIWFFIKLFLVVVSIILSISFIFVIKDLNMLPDKYYKVIIITFIVINILNIICLLPKKNIFNIICIILSIIIIGISSFGMFHGKKIANFLNNSFNNNGLEISEYSVAVLKSSDYNNIKDLDSKLMGYVVIDEDKEEYVSLLKSKANSELVQYNDAYSLYDSLLDKRTDSIVISEGLYQILEDKYQDIGDMIKIIYNFKIEHTIKKEEIEVKELKPINVLISGSDSRSGIIESKTRSDVNMIMTIDPNNHKILLTSIPRDYYVKLHGTTGINDKLTHAGIYGIDMSRQTIEDLFNIKINNTLKVGFQSVIQVVDLLGGIDIESDSTLTTHCGDGGAVRTRVVKGMNHFTGPQALSYARERYAYEEGDNHRVQNQQQVIEAIIDKISQDKSLLSKYDQLLVSLSELYRTDISTDYMKLLVKDQVTNMTSWTIEKQQVSGTASYGQTYSMPGWNLWIMIPNMDSVNEARAKIIEITGEE